MARTLSKGLHYFPKDVDYYDDFKIIDLLSAYGPVGQSIYDFILTQVYKEGYYLEMPIEKLALFAVRAVGSRWVTKELAINVITYCGDIGLFRVDLLEQGVITSAGIQRRYEEVKGRSRCKFDKEKYWILEEDGNEKTEPSIKCSLETNQCTFKGDNCTLMADNCTLMDTKEKERKEKERKVVGRDAPAPPTTDSAVAEIFHAWEDCGFQINAYASERLLAMADEYTAHWVVEAIRRATDRGKKSLGYVEGILRSWEKQGAMDDGKEKYGTTQNGTASNGDDDYDPFAEEEIL